MLHQLVLQYGLKNVLQLEFLVIAGIVIAIATYIAPKYNLHPMREMPQVDAVKEAVGACAERGVPITQTLGNMSLSFPTRDVPGCLEVAKLLATTCAEVNVPCFWTVADPSIHIMTSDYVRQGYTIGGHPERFREENVVYYASGSQIVLGAMDLFETQNCGGLIVWGNFGFAAHMPLMELASRRNAFIIHAQGHTCEGTLGAFFTDLVAVLEEMGNAAPYLSGDVKAQANIFGSDLVKIGYIGLIIGLIVLGLAGVKL